MTSASKLRNVTQHKSGLIWSWRQASLSEKPRRAALAVPGRPPRHKPTWSRGSDYVALLSVPELQASSHFQPSTAHAVSANQHRPPPCCWVPTPDARVVHCRISSSQPTPSMLRCIESSWWAGQPCCRPRVVSSPQSPLSSRGCSTRTRARQPGSLTPTTVYRCLWCRPCGGGLLQAAVGRGSGVLGSNHAAGSWYPPEANMTTYNSPHRTIANRITITTAGCCSQSIPVSTGSSGPYNACSRGKTTFTCAEPPLRTCLEFHRMGCHTPQACNTGAQPRERRPTSPPAQCVCVYVNVHYMHGVPGHRSSDPPARHPRD